MKEMISYYYNLDVLEVEELDGKYHFKIDNTDFFFVFYNRGEEELEDIINISLEMRQKGIDVHKVLINIHNSFLTKINDYNYILFEVTNIGEEYDIMDINEMTKKLEISNSYSKLIRNNWGSLWSSKVDYFEYQVRELALKKEIIKCSFSYYVGLSEVAISYVNNANLKYGKIFNGKIVLSHRRVFYPNYKLNYLNPLSFIFDLEVRDVAEYLKSMFYSKDRDLVLMELSSYLKLAKLNVYECHMLMARLLYPSFYFDIYDEIMNKDGNEEKLVEIIKSSDEYEIFLKNAYFEISKYAKLEKINWLIDSH